MKVIFAIIFFISFNSFSQASLKDDEWNVFARVKFSEKYFKEYDERYLFPLFDTKIRVYEGKEFMLKGHYLPLDLSDRRIVIISKFPYSMCFFCGGAGPESVAEVHFASRPPKFKADQIITVKGKLKLNDTDVTHMNFILENATLLTE